VIKAKSLKHVCSDHLPIMMEIKLPESLEIEHKFLVADSVEVA